MTVNGTVGNNSKINNGIMEKTIMIILKINTVFPALTIGSYIS
jgi:hypothetical protein